jgi:hypothetical protein
MLRFLVIFELTFVGVMVVFAATASSFISAMYYKGSGVRVVAPTHPSSYCNIIYHPPRNQFIACSSIEQSKTKRKGGKNGDNNDGDGHDKNFGNDGDRQSKHEEPAAPPSLSDPTTTASKREARFILPEKTPPFNWEPPKIKTSDPAKTEFMNPAHESYSCARLLLRRVH